MVTPAQSVSEIGAQKIGTFNVRDWYIGDYEEYECVEHFLYVAVQNTGVGTLYLHAHPRIGEEVIVADHSGTAEDNPIIITVGNVSHVIISTGENSVGIDTNYGYICLKYIADDTWIILHGR
jgi:hypothetical protein